MRSRADWRSVGELMLTVAALCVSAALLWSLARTPPAAVGDRRWVSVAGILDSSTPPRGDTLRVRLLGVPNARARDLLRAWRESGVVVQLESADAFSPLAIGMRARHPLVGGTVVDVVSPRGAAVGDVGGTLDSLGGSGTLTRLDAPRTAVASVAGVRASSSTSPAQWGDRVLVAGGISWEARFVTAALEEAGWKVDATFRVAPTVDVRQGNPGLSRERHAAVVLLDGAPAAVIDRVPSFIRGGGGAVLVGEVARMSALAAVRAGTPGRDLAGEAGAEASSDPRRGLDAVTFAAAEQAITIEARDGATIIAARRVGGGRVVQTGYENSWLWRMAGDATAPGAHRMWWSTMVASVIPPAAAPHRAPVPWVDTLDAAPVAALAASLGLPVVGASATLSAPGLQSGLHRIPPWVWLSLALAGWCGAWILRRWQGFP
jgi:hypothetical protein